MGFGSAIVGSLKMPGVAYAFSRLGYNRRAKTFRAADLERSLAGRTYVVTGANSGIGKEVARGLAERDADVWLLCRNRERGEAAQAELDALGNGAVKLELVDMSDLSSIALLLERWKPAQVTALVHNAGALFHERVNVPPGVERTFALHVLGPEALTRGLLPALRRGQGRVVYVASGGMYAERLSVDLLRCPPDPFDGTRAYARAKRAQVVLTQMWAEREREVGFFVMHPGWADTPGVETALPGFYKVTKRFLRTPAEGADTALWLAAAENTRLPSGAFVFDRAEAKRHLMPGTRADRSEWDRLWNVVDGAVAAPATTAREAV